MNRDFRRSFCAIGEEEYADPAPEPETEEPAAVKAIPVLIKPTTIARALKLRPKH